MLERSHLWLSRALIAAAITWLTFVMCWLFYQNTLFTESYDALNLTSNDELIFHTIIHAQRQALRDGRWADFFSNTHAAYGNTYWSLLGILTWPFYEMGWHSWVMAIPKQLSLISLLACFVFMYLICRKRGYSDENILLCLCLSASSAAAMYTAGMLQTNLPVAALVMAAIFCLSSIQRPKLAAALFGLAVGVKLTAILFLPAFLLFSETSWRRLGLSALIITTSALVCYSPALLAYPFGVHSADASFYELVNTLRFNSLERETTKSISSLLTDGFFTWNYRPGILVAGLVASGWALARQRNRMSFIFLVSLVAVIIMLLRLKNEPLYLCLYTLPVVYLMPLIFLEMRLPRFTTTLLLLCLCFYNYSVNNHTILGLLSDVYTRHSSEKIKRQRQIYSDIKKTVRFYPQDKVVVSATMAVPVGLFEVASFTSYYRPQDTPEIWTQNNVFAFNEGIEGWTESCGELMLHADRCPVFQLVVAKNPSYKILYSAPDAFVIRVK